MADPATVRTLKIKTGVVKRLAKEKSYYKKEVVKEEEKIEKMKADGKDEYDIKKQGEVISESKMMIPDTQRKLKTGIEDLEKWMEACDADVKGMEEFKAAEEVLQNGNEVMAAE